MGTGRSGEQGRAPQRHTDASITRAPRTVHPRRPLTPLLSAYHPPLSCLASHKLCAEAFIAAP